MKQVIQSRRTGKLALKDIPEPKVRAGHLLVQTRASLISAGTERMVVDFAKKSLAGKARARPDLVKKVIDKAKRDGLAATLQTVMSRLDEPLPLGYSAAGDVIAVGAGLEGRFRVGERIAMAGAGVANHAEVNLVPGSLAAPVPAGVSDAEACYGTLGAIALHAVRNLAPGLGDWVAVIGVGLVGQLATQFQALSGARVIALDYDAARLDLAAAHGAEASCDLNADGAAERIAALTAGRGCDGILIAAATGTSEPFELAAQIARDRARITLVGATGTEIPYAAFMKKELNLVVSRSYGPGRYDPDFEDRGVKYPAGWVPWTETDNLAECLRLMAHDGERRLDVAALTTHTFDIEAAEAAYNLVTGGGSEAHLGVVLSYPGERESAVKPAFAVTTGKGAPCVLGMIGGGNFASAVLLPELRKMNGVSLHTLATQRGATAEHGKEKFGFAHAAADESAVFDNPDINAVLVATRHDSHAELTARALESGKAVLVEKPLGLSFEDLNRVIAARDGIAEESGAFFQVGFNRRFAPLSATLRGHLADAGGTRVLTVRVNAGAIDASHWVHAADEGGGRIIGEMCHFIDLARYLMGSPITSVMADAARTDAGACDDVSATLRFADGGLATVIYAARGDSAVGKERIEAFAGGRTFVLEDFKRLEVSGKSNGSGTQDKGFRQQLDAFTRAVADGGPAPIDEAELIETSSATLAVMESLRTGGRVDV